MYSLGIILFEMLYKMETGMERAKVFFFFFFFKRKKKKKIINKIYLKKLIYLYI